MTMADGRLAHIVVPSRVPICPANVVPAASEPKSSAEFAANASVPVGNSPTIVVTAAAFRGCGLSSRTTIA